MPRGWSKAPVLDGHFGSRSRFLFLTCRDQVPCCFCCAPVRRPLHRRCVRMGPGFEGPSSTFGEMAFSERRIPCSPVREVASAEAGQGSSTAEFTIFTTAQQSAQGSRSERQCRSPTVGDGHFSLRGDEPTRQASGGSVADHQSEVCSPSSPAEDSVLQTLYRTRQAVCGPSRGCDHESHRAEGDL